MLRSLYVTFDYHIAGTDGEVGTVEDFLFDDESWIIHYLVARIATQPRRTRVLIIPFAVEALDWETHSVRVNLSCEDIRKSPPLVSDLPVWLQRASGFKQPGSHLRSMREILGYAVHGTDGEAGQVEDFIIEDTLWGVHHIAVFLKSAPGRSVLLSPEAIRSISWRGKAAWANLTLGEMEQSPTYEPGLAVNESPDHHLYDYYGRPVERHVPPIRRAS